MHKPVKYAEKVLTYGAKGAWAVFEKINSIKPRLHSRQNGQTSRY